MPGRATCVPIEAVGAAQNRAAFPVPRGGSGVGLQPGRADRIQRLAVGHGGDGAVEEATVCDKNGGTESDGAVSDDLVNQKLAVGSINQKWAFPLH